MAVPDDNVATIRRLHDALSTRDAGVIQEVFAPDAEIAWGGD